MVPGAGRVVLVTGASRGIGRASALALAAEGYRLVLAARDHERLATVAGEAGALGAEAVAVRCDVTAEDDVRDLFVAARDAFGRCDVLFNNAGIAAPGATPDAVALEDWSAVVATNLTGAFLCTRAAFALMRAQDPPGGRIINNGSISAHVPRPGSIAYTATKHAVTGLTRATALDGRPFGIACGQIDIGNAATGLAATMAGGPAPSLTAPGGEATMDVADVARAVCYMAGLPLEANVLTMTVMATGMAYVGRG